MLCFLKSFIERNILLISITPKTFCDIFVATNVSVSKLAKDPSSDGGLGEGSGADPAVIPFNPSSPCLNTKKQTLEKLDTLNILDTLDYSFSVINPLLKQLLIYR